MHIHVLMKPRSQCHMTKVGTISSPAISRQSSVPLPHLCLETARTMSIRPALSIISGIASSSSSTTRIARTYIPSLIRSKKAFSTYPPKSPSPLSHHKSIASSSTRPFSSGYRIRAPSEGAADAAPGIAIT
jgi:hypothetical protein